jgi:sulfur carrier protein
LKAVVNGKDIEIDIENITVLEMMKKLQVTDKVMAAAINMEVVKKDDWHSKLICDGDKVEFLQFVGGG